MVIGLHYLGIRGSVKGFRIMLYEPLFVGLGIDDGSKGCVPRGL